MSREFSEGRNMREMFESKLFRGGGFFTKNILGGENCPGWVSRSPCRIISLYVQQL